MDAACYTGDREWIIVRKYWSGMDSNNNALALPKEITNIIVIFEKLNRAVIPYWIATVGRIIFLKGRWMWNALLHAISSCWSSARSVMVGVVIFEDMVFD
jgi:hypothetical protein